MRSRFDAFRDRVLHPRSRGVRQRSSDSAAQPAEQPDGLRRPALIVGLGNPGAEYGRTRHNVGAWCVSLLARRHGAALERHGRVDHATVEVAGHSLHLARPRALVNVSGPPIAAELRRLEQPVDRLLVVYDELDLPVGQVRIRPHGGHGGHNGVRSLVDALGGGGFARVRVGIDRPYDGGEPVRDPERIAGWVLSEPTAGERERLLEAVALAADAVETAVAEGLDIAMNRFNRR